MGDDSRHLHDRITLSVERIDDSVPVPAYAYPGDAGLDIASAEDLEVAPFERVLVRTGLKVAIPRGFAGFIQPRSGFSFRTGLAIINSPGLIDSEYRGEVKVPVVNLDPKVPVAIHRGDRIAQLVIMAVADAHVLETRVDCDTERGEGGFGSSGVGTGTPD